MMAMNNEYPGGLPFRGGTWEDDFRTAGTGSFSESRPPQPAEAQSMPEQAAAPAPSAEDVRQQAALLIADALLQAEQMVWGAAREADLSAAQEAIAALRSLGEYVERCVTALIAERTEIEQQIRMLQGLVHELTGITHALRAGEAAPWAPEEAEGVPAPVPEEPAAPMPVFPAGAPLALLVHEVSNFNLLVQLERLLSSCEAVESAGIESYQEEQARFVLVLRHPVTATVVRDMLAEELGRDVAIEKADPEWGELVLRLEPVAPPLAA